MSNRNMFERGEISFDQWHSPEWEEFVDGTYCDKGCILSAHAVGGYCFGCQETCDCNQLEISLKEVERYEDAN